MKQYAYASVSFSAMASSSENAHRQIIDEYARRGYRYVGYIPTRMVGYGKLKQIDLVFETDTNDAWTAQ